MTLYGLALIFLVANFCATVYCQRTAECCEEYCYDLDSDRTQSLHFGTKTGYQVIKGQDTNRHYLVPSKRLYNTFKLASSLQCVSQLICSLILLIIN